MWVEKERFSDKVQTQSCRDARAVAEKVRGHTDGPLEILMWSDGSRLESRKTATKKAWKQHQECKTRRDLLGNNKEVFDTELYVITKAMEVVLGYGQTVSGMPFQRPTSRWTKKYI